MKLRRRILFHNIIVGWTKLTNLWTK